MDRAKPNLSDLDGAHFMGIGGVGMGSIAQVLLSKGMKVSGSDAVESDNTRRLRELGARVAIGHSADNIVGASGMVVSSAIDENNPELVAAREAGLPVWHRSEALGALMASGRSVAVAGCHGKTTTTLMVSDALVAAGLNPTTLVGGWVKRFEGCARIGSRDLIVTEADESDGSFLNLRADVAVITNIDFDHPEHYADMGEVHDAFARFVNQTPPDAIVVVDADDPGSAAIRDRLERDVIACGLDAADADVRGAVIEEQALESFLRLRVRGADAGTLRLPVGGLHNARNALLALGAGLALGADLEQCRRGLEAFAGVRRRFELLGQAQGVRLYDDYAHHPREVEVTLGVAARLREQDGGRVVAVFQPHRYTRTQALAEAFGPSFAQADALVITDVYAAGDAPIPGVSGQSVLEAALRAGHANAQYCQSLGDIADLLAPTLRPGDIVMTLGAGDITDLGPRILKRLREG